ncbi:MAG: 4-alpha-glucanotransferase [Stagnimonas sp.]|nr:4-alpha-glucanotransferase [Stagnimonas sp.]
MSPWIERSAGLLLHISSLPGGRADAEALRFADFMVAAGFRVWQILPVGPVDVHGSPYHLDSGFAGDPRLVADQPEPDAPAYSRYLEQNADWLDDYALFSVLSQVHAGLAWNRWPAALRHREPAALAAALQQYRPELDQVRRQQCRFELGWAGFRHQLQARGLLLFGDVPLFLAHHSADVWAHQQLFEVDAEGECEAFLGVPPDGFAADGQWWGYPAYRWPAMAAENYRWWRRRFEVQAQRFDLVRLDHFRGFAAYWRIPRGARTAAAGAWVSGPGRAAIEALQPVLGSTRLVAEDLGHITEDVVALRQSLGIPGMRVLQFGFDGDPHNPHLPAQHAADTVCYTGTHDNDTTLGWWSGLEPAVQQQIRQTLGDDSPMPGCLLAQAWASPAPLAIAPLQDLLGLGSAARMNRPGVEAGNWNWRFQWADLPADLAARTRAALERQGRAWPPPA